MTTLRLGTKQRELLYELLNVRVFFEHGYSRLILPDQDFDELVEFERFMVPSAHEDEEDHILPPKRMRALMQKGCFVVDLDEIEKDEPTIKSTRVELHMTQRAREAARKVKK